MIKYQLTNQVKWTGLLARPALLNLTFWFEYLISNIWFWLLGLRKRVLGPQCSQNKLLRNFSLEIYLRLCLYQVFYQQNYLTENIKHPFRLKKVFPSFDNFIMLSVLFFSISDESVVARFHPCLTFRIQTHNFFLFVNLTLLTVTIWVRSPIDLYGEKESNSQRNHTSHGRG